jgi:putative ABC transport system permease protein
MLKRTNWISNFWIAVEAIMNQKLRSLLTSLGLIFGVASVISMLSIGKGAEQEILEQLKILGTNNIIIKPVIEQEEGEIAEESTKTEEKKKFSPGLTLSDCNYIQKVVPEVEFISPEITLETLVIRSGLKRSVKLVGVNDKYY